jgi:hypothetical protein
MSRTFTNLKVAALSALVVVPVFAQESGRPELANLALELKTDKTEYLPGELMELRFRLFPRSGTAAAPDRISVVDGSLGILVSHGSDGYLEYQGPDWGVKKTSMPVIVMLNGDQAVEAMGTLLYNCVPETAHLSPLYARQALAERIPHEYALGEAGPVLLKAVYQDRFSENRLESDPVQIYIREATGEDAEVWNTLRASPKLGYLLQTGLLPGSASEAEEDEAAAVLQDLLTRHPATTYAGHISRGLQRFRKFVQTQRGRSPNE